MRGRGLLTDGELAWVYGPRRARSGDGSHRSGCARRRRRLARHRPVRRRRRSFGSIKPDLDNSGPTPNRLRLRNVRERTKDTPHRTRDARHSRGHRVARRRLTRRSRRSYQSVNYMQEIGTGDGLALSTRYGNSPNAERGAAARSPRSRAPKRRCCWAAEWARRRARCLPCSAPATTCSPAHRSTVAYAALLTKEFTPLGIDVTLVDPLEPRVWRKRLRKETRAIFIESPVNPTCRVLDLRPISYITKEVGIALVVDSTFASPVNFRPLEHGADVVIHSATKYLNGHHDVLGGIVCGTSAYIEEVRQKMMVWGQTPDPFARVAARARAQDARRARAPAQRERNAHRRLVRRTQGDQARALPRAPRPSRPRGRARRCSTALAA